MIEDRELARKDRKYWRSREAEEAKRLFLDSLEEMERRESEGIDAIAEEIYTMVAM
jgi:hypothetical protein